MGGRKQRAPEILLSKEEFLGLGAARKEKSWRRPEANKWLRFSEIFSSKFLSRYFREDLRSNYFRPYFSKSVCSEFDLAGMIFPKDSDGLPHQRVPSTAATIGQGCGSCQAPSEIAGRLR